MSCSRWGKRRVSLVLCITDRSHIYWGLIVSLYPAVGRIIPIINENDAIAPPATADADLDGVLSVTDNDSLARY